MKTGSMRWEGLTLPAHRTTWPAAKTIFGEMAEK